MLTIGADLDGAAAIVHDEIERAVSEQAFDLAESRVSGQEIAEPPERKYFNLHRELTRLRNTLSDARYDILGMRR